jgi:predicted urease superfamily metal-dependent hydrolase
MVDLHAMITVRMGKERHESTVGRISCGRVIPQDNLMSLRYLSVAAEVDALAAMDALKKGQAFSDVAADFCSDAQKAGRIPGCRAVPKRRIQQGSFVRTQPRRISSSV